MTFCWKKIVVFLFVTTLSYKAFAAGYLLEAESAAALGEALSGGSAIAADASTNFYNPAGLTRFRCPQFVGSGELFLLKAKFTGTTSSSYQGLFSVNRTITGSTEAPVNAPIPALYGVTPLVPGWLWIGFGVTSPVGITINYPAGSLTRFAVKNEEFQSANLNINLGFKLLQELSLGFGVNVVRVVARGVNSVLNPEDSSVGAEWVFDYDTSNYAFGVNVGALYEPTECTRIGLSYRARINIQTNGFGTLNTFGTFTPSPGAPLDTNFHLTFNAPPITILSIYQKVNPRWEVMGTVEIEQWTYLTDITAQNVPIPTLHPIDVTFPMSFSNTVTYTVGTRFKWDDKWKFKSGVAYVPSSVASKDRNLYIPATSSYIIAVGAHYQWNRNLGVDVAFAHPFFRAASMNHSHSISVDTPFGPVTNTTTEIGTSQFSGNVLGAQFTYDLV